MVKYILLRVLLLIVTLFLIMTLVYFTTSLVSMRRWVDGRPFTVDFVFVWHNYVEYLQNIVNDWHWGYHQYDQEVWELFVRRAPRTLRLNAIAFLFYMTTGILLGTIAAAKRGKTADNVISFIILIFSSIPAYVLIMVLIIVFSYRLGFPPPLMPSPTTSLWWRMSAYILPVFVMSALPVANITRIVRGEMAELFGSDQLLLLQTKGLSRNTAIRRHFVRGASVPVLPEIVPSIVYALTGSFIVEIIYNVRGLAAWLYDSLIKPYADLNYILIQTEPTVLIVVCYAAIAMAAGILVDISYHFLDPRMRIGSKK